MENVPGSSLLSYLSYSASIYYAIQVALQLGALAGIGYTIRQYGADAGAILAAVQQLAGNSSGISVVDRAQLVVNTIKVAQTLDRIFDQLSEQPSASKVGRLGQYSFQQHCE